MTTILKLRAGAALMTILATAPAYAQSVASEQGGLATGSETGARQLGDIIVTARRTNERLQDVPVAVTAISGERLQQLGIQQVTDIRLAVPGVALSSSAGRTSTPSFGIRGQRTGDVLITQDQPVTLYLDEAVITPINGANLGLFDLENVQVLKGPQGTLFGRNTTGGAVLFTTAKPTSEFGGSIRLGIGSYGMRNGTAVVNLPLSERIRLRAGVDYTNTDGYGRVVATPGSSPLDVGRRLQSRDELNMRLTAAIDLSDTFKTMTTAYFSRANNAPAAFVQLDQPNPGGLAATFFPGIQDAYLRAQNRSVYDSESSRSLSASLSSVRTYGVIHTDTVELGDNLTFKNILSYRHLKNNDRFDIDGTIFPIADPAGNTEADLYTEEAQFQGKAFDDRLTYIFGFYYFDLRGTDGAGVPGNPGNVSVGRPNTAYGTVHNRSISGFGQASYKLTDTLNLTGGVRYTIDQRKTSVVSGNFPLTTCSYLDPATNVRFPADACVVTNDKPFSEPSWLISLDKKLDEDTLVYIASRHSFRAGGFNLRANTVAFANEFFRPEKVTDIELGFKTTQDLGDVRVTANLAGHYQWYSDIQRNLSTVRNGVLGNITQNAAKAHIMGGEAEFGIRFARLINFSASYALVKPTYDSYPTRAPVFGVPDQPDDYSDRTFAYIPRHQITANLIVTPDIGSIGELSLMGNLYYQSAVVFSEDAQTRAQLVRRLAPAAAATLPADLTFGQNGYVLVNVRAELNNIAGSALSAAVYARNLFDKRYLDAELPFMDSLGINTGVYGAPRTFGMEISYKF